jgi:hypothetical protein
MLLTPEQEERFWTYVERTPWGCWLWKGAKSRPPGGKHYYGTFRVGKRMLKAHRVAYILRKGDPGKLDVCHTCDTTLCCRPSHLYAGTHQDNMNDKVRRGRAPQAGASKINAAKTHCPKGHPYNEKNTCYSGGARYCRRCARDKMRRRRLNN